jgi:hypothetical protein
VRKFQALRNESTVAVSKNVTARTASGPKGTSETQDLIQAEILNPSVPHTVSGGTVRSRRGFPPTASVDHRSPSGTRKDVSW